MGRVSAAALTASLSAVASLAAAQPVHMQVSPAVTARVERLLRN